MTQVVYRPYPALAYIFIYFALITGAAFMFMSLSGDTTGITMYQVVQDALGQKGTFTWGALSVFAGAGTLLFGYTHKLWIATVSSTLGLVLWLYLTWLYVLSGYIDGVLAAAVPNLWFWIWYSARASAFMRLFFRYGLSKESGQEVLTTGLERK